MYLCIVKNSPLPSSPRGGEDVTDPGSGSDGTYNSGGGGSDRRLWILNTIVRNLLCLSRQFILKYNEIKYTGYRQAYRKGTPDAYKTEAEINA